MYILVLRLLFFINPKYFFSGCRDRNECDYGSYAENTHNCVRSSNTGICMNNAGLKELLLILESWIKMSICSGSFSCGSCSTSGTRYYGSSGTIKRFLFVYTKLSLFVQTLLLFSFHQTRLLTATATHGGTARTQTSSGTLRFQQTTIHR